MIDWKRTLTRSPFALRKTGGIAMTSRPYPPYVLWGSKSSPLVCIIKLILINLRQLRQSHTLISFIFIEYRRPMRPTKTVLPSRPVVVCANGGSSHTVPSINRHPSL